MRQSRWVTSATLVAVVALGLGARALPGLTGDLAGGVLYAVAVSVAVVIARPRIGAGWAATLGVLISCGVELLQALGVARSVVDGVPPARLLLGTTFAWWDLLAYLVGGGVAYGLLAALRKRGT